MAVIIIGTILSRFAPGGMELTMFATALALLFVVIIALLSGMHDSGSSVGEIIGVNAFFATLFALSGVLFRSVALEQAEKKSEG